MLSPDFKVEKKNLIFWRQGGLVWFSGKQRESHLETTANVSYNDHNKKIRLKDTLTLNNFPRTTLLNTFFFKVKI